MEIFRRGRRRRRRKRKRRKVWGEEREGESGGEGGREREEKFLSRRYNGECGVFCDGTECSCYIDLVVIV